MAAMKKRMREDREVGAVAMAKCLMLLSRVGATAGAGGGRAFACKTCHREFSSFQALGGHRASHKRPRLMGGLGDDLHLHVESAPPAKRPKSHECSICGLEFAMGQALGGHMRRHRLSITEALSPNNSSDDDSSGNSKSADRVPVLNNESNLGKRAVVCLDLNLTPVENHIQKMKKLPSWLLA